MPFNLPVMTDERDALAGNLQFQHDALRAVAHGLTDAQSRQAPSVSQISIAWLIKHLAVVQRNWLDGAYAAPAALTSEQNEVIMARSHDVTDDDTLDGLLAAFDEVSDEVLAAVRTLDPDTPLPVPDAPWFPRDIAHWSVRWVWQHLIQEIARHAGHGDIVRESIDGATAYELIAAHDGHTEPVFGFIEPWRPSLSR